MKARVEGVSAVGAGVADWEDARALLRGEQEWRPEPLSLPSPTLLSPNERRRASPFVNMALTAAAEACERAGQPRDSLDCLFASALGDGSIAHAVLSALIREGRPISPTQFHNSVHNAVAGYWSIGTVNRQPASSLAAGDGSFGAALLKALMSVTVERRPVLLVALDHPFPGPLAEKRPVAAPLAVAIVLAPVDEDARPSASGAFTDGPILALNGPCNGPASEPSAPSLAALWAGVSAGRALPLLEALERPCSVVVEAGADYFLDLEVRTS